MLGASPSAEQAKPCLACHLQGLPATTTLAPGMPSGRPVAIVGGSRIGRLAHHCWDGHGGWRRPRLGVCQGRGGPAAGAGRAGAGAAGQAPGAGRPLTGDQAPRGCGRGAGAVRPSGSGGRCPRACSPGAGVTGAGHSGAAGMGSADLGRVRINRRRHRSDRFWLGWWVRPVPRWPSCRRRREDGRPQGRPRGVEKVSQLPQQHGHNGAGRRHAAAPPPASRPIASRVELAPGPRVGPWSTSSHIRSCSERPGPVGHDRSALRAAHRRGRLDPHRPRVPGQ
jgi:hypothetical protein